MNNKEMLLQEIKGHTSTVMSFINRQFSGSYDQEVLKHNGVAVSVEEMQEQRVNIHGVLSCIVPFSIATTHRDTYELLHDDFIGVLDFQGYAMYDIRAIVVGQEANRSEPVCGIPFGFIETPRLVVAHMVLATAATSLADPQH